MVTAKTHVAILLDKSHSMLDIKMPIITDFNEQIQTIQDRASEIDTKVTYVTFNHDVTFEFINEDAENLKELDQASYVPRGGTALRDAIGVTIDKVKEVTNEDTPVLFIIISDGADMSSTMYSVNDVAEKIQTMTDKYGWTFTYVGADHDVESVVKNLNIPVSNAMKISKSAAGIGASVGCRSLAYGKYTASIQHTAQNLAEGESLSMNSALDDNFFSEDGSFTDLDSGNSSVSVTDTTVQEQFINQVKTMSTKPKKRKLKK
jgi:hypothetical protein